MVGSKDLKPSPAPFYPNVFFHNQFRAHTQWPAGGTDLSGQTAIITGSNIGLGYEAALQLLKLKLSRLIIAVRSLEKGRLAADTMKFEFPAADIQVWHLDMDSYDSIQTFVQKASLDLHRIDIVILNAGVGRVSYHMNTTTGHEECLQVNYLSTMLLLILLLPILKGKKATSGQPTRLTITSAALTLIAKLQHKDESPLFPALDKLEHFDGMANYQDSKLLAQMFLWKLVDYVLAEDVIVSLADPAWVRGTEFGRDLDDKKLVKVILYLIQLMVARSPQVGASCLVDAVVNKGKEVHGCFLMSWKVHAFASCLYTEEGQRIIEKVWDETLGEFEFVDARRIIESMRS